MSLVKQLWLAVTLVMLSAFGISLVVNVYSSRQYLEQQLQIKNIDNATSLALSLSQMQKDPPTLELMVSSQFDIGHYRFIRIVSPSGQVLVEKHYEGTMEDVPQWFIHLIPLRVQSGQALIQDGWKQYGTLTLASHDQYAYKSLWDGTRQLLVWFLFGGLLTGWLGMTLLRVITRPLLDVVAQAQALAERRFQTVKEPRTPELRAVTHAMNHMVGLLKSMFAEEAQRLETLRDRVNHDAVTGLANREHFLSQLNEVLHGEQHGSTGSLVIIRLDDLNRLNDKLGHQGADRLLKSLSDMLHDGQQDCAGRLKGGEFAVVYPSQDSATQAAQDLHTRLAHDWLPQWQAECPDLFHLAAVRYQRHQSLGELLAQADQVLAQAQAKGPNNWQALENGSSKLAIPAEQWRSLLTDAIRVGRLSLSFFPVVKGAQGQLLHREGSLRLQTETAAPLLTAGDFLPMAAKLKLTAPIDLEVVRLALSGLRESSGNMAVNLSAESIADFSFRKQLGELLQAQSVLRVRLLFEVPEYGVARHFEAFQDLTHQLKSLGCRVGIKYFGQDFLESGKLASLGLDCIKVDPGYVRGIGSHSGNQEFLTGLCTMAHALGMLVIAAGVEQAQDMPLLVKLGFDGMTGPGVVSRTDQL